MSTAGPSLTNPPRASVHDVDLRTGTYDDTFARNLYELLHRSRQVYTPSAEIVETSVRQNERDLREWWDAAETQSAALGSECRELKAQTSWYKRFNKALAGIKSAGSPQEMLRDPQVSLPVKRITDQLLEEGAKATLLFPGVVKEIDKETGRGMIATIPLMPGTLIGQFTGVMYADGVSQSTKLEDEYSIVFGYGGEKYLVNPFLDLTDRSIETGAFLNEPRSDFERGKPTGLYDDSDKSATSKGRDYTWSVLGKRVRVSGMEWTMKIPTAIEIKSGERIPLSELEIDDRLREKLVANIECVNAELPLCFYELVETHSDDRAIFFLKKDRVHADMSVRRQNVCNLCDMIVNSRKTPFEQTKLTQKQPLRDFDILRLRGTSSSDDTFIACERYVVVLPSSHKDMVSLRFFRSRNTWYVPERQIAVIPKYDGRPSPTLELYVPFPWYRVGILPVKPGMELLFRYNKRESLKRGLAAFTASSMGPRWQRLPPESG